MVFKTIGNKSNPVILFFHAMGVIGESSMPVAEKMKEKYYCIMPTSTVYCSGQRYQSKRDEIQQIVRFLENHGIKEIELAVASSIGADLAMAYAYDAEALQLQKAREDAAKQRIFAILPEEQAQELIALFDEFEEYETAESKFAHAMDNIQPLILNNSNNGGDWREHDVTVEQIYKRQSKTKLGSEKLFEITDCIIQENVKKGNLKY